MSDAAAFWDIFFDQEEGPTEGVRFETESADTDGPEKEPAAKSPALRGVDCLLLGPPRAGKSSLVAALEQACYADDSPGVELRSFSSSRPRCGARGVLHSLLSQQVTPTDSRQAQTHLFDIGRYQPTGLRAIQSLRIREEPGQRVFPTTPSAKGTPLAWPHARDERQRCLVLLVDSIYPAASLWAAHIPDIVRGLCLQTAARKAGSPRRSVSKVDRVLVLLTKIDLFCDRLSQHAAEISHLTGYHSPPLEMAQRMDPIQQALAFLGHANLKMLRALVPDTQRFAIGLVSAAGFDPQSGESLLTNAASASTEDLIKRWTPYGIKDALHFITFGRHTGNLCSIPSIHPDSTGWNSIHLDNKSWQRMNRHARS